MAFDRATVKISGFGWEKAGNHLEVKMNIKNRSSDFLSGFVNVSAESVNDGRDGPTVYTVGVLDLPFSLSPAEEKELAGMLVLERKPTGSLRVSKRMVVQQGDGSDVDR